VFTSVQLGGRRPRRLLFKAATDSDEREGRLEPLIEEYCSRKQRRLVQGATNAHPPFVHIDTRATHARRSGATRTAAERRPASEPHFIPLR